MRLAVTLESADASSQALEESVLDILGSTRLLALSTIGDDGGPRACNLYYAHDTRCRLYFLTPPTTEHARNLERDQRVAVAVADTQQTGDRGKRGLQFVGTGSRAAGPVLDEGLAAYRLRFPATRDALRSQASIEASGMESRVYVIVPQRLKVFDERLFGEERWIDAAIDG